jgi:hypothetical protein
MHKCMYVRMCSFGATEILCLLHELKVILPRKLLMLSLANNYRQSWLLDYTLSILLDKFFATYSHV